MIINNMRKHELMSIQLHYLFYSLYGDSSVAELGIVFI
jgi:hypothetical protein